MLANLICTYTKGQEVWASSSDYGDVGFSSWRSDFDGVIVGESGSFWFLSEGRDVVFQSCCGDLVSGVLVCELGVAYLLLLFFLLCSWGV